VGREDSTVRRPVPPHDEGRPVYHTCGGDGGSPNEEGLRGQSPEEQRGNGEGECRFDEPANRAEKRQLAPERVPDVPANDVRLGVELIV
jgi:hypothetical protein